MAYKKKILYIDDVAIDRRAKVDLLEDMGYQVFETSSIEETKQKLAEVTVHMMIVDLNLKGDDDDDTDRSGLELIKDPAYFSIPKVILTGYAEDPETMMQTLNLPHGTPKPVAYIGKNKAGADQKLIDAFEESVNVNWDLQINWASPTLGSLTMLAGLVVPDAEHSYLSHCMDELEDLLRQIFLDSQTLTISRLLTYSGSIAWLEVSTTKQNTLREYYMLACGQNKHMQNQTARYNEFIALNANTGSVRSVKQKQTLHFAVTLYECIGGNVSEMMPLNDLYLRSPLANIQPAIEHLINSTFHTRHTASSTVEISDLHALYKTWTHLDDKKQKQDTWKAKIRSLCDAATSLRTLQSIDYSENDLTFFFESVDAIKYSCPVYFFFETGAVLNMPLSFGTVHGHLHLSDILIDPYRQSAWLIDFSHIRKAPILFDFVALESALKAELLTLIDIDDWSVIEQRLLTATSLDDPLVIENEYNDQVEKILHMLTIIRKGAITAVNGDIRIYLAGLFVYALSQLDKYEHTQHYTTQTLAPCISHLLSAAMICPYLETPRQFEIFYKDEYVLVEGEEKRNLASAEWQILEFMDKSAGQPTTVKEMLLQIYQDAPDDIDNGAWMKTSGKPKVIAAIRRMREKLEPNQSNPRYILTTNQGYRLEK